MKDWQPIGDAAREVVDRLFRCEHRNQRVVWTGYANDGSEYQKRQLRNYCDDCGRLVGGALKHSLATADTPELSREDAMRQDRLWREYAEQRDIEKRRQTEQWRADYEAYLQTQEWADRRDRIFKRASGACEGCGEAPAEQVHHLSYEHCGNEFLWELVAICRRCHLTVHGIEETNE
jgi:5-methylcytosine-specific restriction endonuclease McrA